MPLLVSAAGVSFSWEKKEESGTSRVKGLVSVTQLHTLKQIILHNQMLAMCVVSVHAQEMS